MLLLESLQARLEHHADALDVVHHAALDELREKRQRRAAREQVAAVRAAVVAVRNRLRDLFADERRANRDAGAERLAERDDVRLEAERLEVERHARAAKAALDFVADQQRAGSGAGLVDRG